MSINQSDIAEEMHFEDEKISQLHSEWELLSREIKFNDTEKDNVKIRRIRDIEFEIDEYYSSRSIRECDYPTGFDWLKSWTPLSKQKKLELQKKQGGRPKDLYIAEQKAKLRTLDLKLRQKGWSSKQCLKELQKNFPQWTTSTIETYIKK